MFLTLCIFLTNSRTTCNILHPKKLVTANKKWIILNTLYKLLGNPVNLTNSSCLIFLTMVKLTQWNKKNKWIKEKREEKAWSEVRKVKSCLKIWYFKKPNMKKLKIFIWRTSFLWTNYLKQENLLFKNGIKWSRKATFPYTQRKTYIFLSSKV